MEVINQELFDKAVEFLNSCKDQNVLILHDYDVDGISGGTILYYALQRIGATPLASTKLGRAASMYPDHLEEIQKKFIPDRIIINDQDPIAFHKYEKLREIFPSQEIMIMDHHFVTEYNDALFVHPEHLYNLPGSDVPSAKMIYDICQRATEIEDISWLAFNGILGDSGTEHFQDFLVHVSNLFDIELPADPYESELAIVAEAIECACAIGEEDLLTYADQLKQNPDVHDALGLGNPYKVVKEQLDYYVENWQDFAVLEKTVKWVNIESEYGINGWSATLISLQNPDTLFAVWREQVDGVSVNMRYQNTPVHLGKILRPLAESLGGSGGGHAPASGGFIPKAKWEEFKILFSKEVESAISEVTST